ncbi:mannosyltransferase putative-domain-containing protein [Gautieria morchelliformis]|nr:mannosyltransferase putative-domain-containing protein [Gautieria morchelliformis]
MAASPPTLPIANSAVAQSNWAKWAILQLKLIRKNPGGGAARRLLFVLLTGVLCALVVYTFSISLSPLQPFRKACYPAPSPSPKFGHVPPTHLYPLSINATLEERLQAFRNAPGVGWEPPDFVAWNLETCSNVVPNHNKDLIAKSSLTWAVLNSTTIIHHRERMARFLEQKVEAGAFDLIPIKEGGRGLIGKGRGIVFTAGNADTLNRVVWTLRLIREHYHCTLPAAIFHFPSERPEPDSPIHADLRSLNATLVEASGRDRDPTRTKNYHLKAQSIVECEWAEVIYLDSDNLPAIDPELLFEAPNYKRLGVYFTPDYWKTSASNPIWHIIGVQCRDEWEQEAGQIIVDKRRHLDAMLLSLYMLTDWRFWFYFSDGDKDVFRFAMLALRKRWALPGRYVGAGGFPRGTGSGEFCGNTMQQYDHIGRPAFIHYNLLKQIPSGVYRGFSWGRTKQVVPYPQPPAAVAPPASESTSDTRPRRLQEAPYPDIVTRDAHDVEADMLANADDDGWTIYPGSDEVRRRAALERGIRPFFHGGVYSALCIDLAWEDPAPKDNPRSKQTVREGDREKLVSAPNPLGINWDASPLEVVNWGDDDRLARFEDRVYDLGFIPNGKGF